MSIFTIPLCVHMYIKQRRRNRPINTIIAEQMEKYYDTNKVQVKITLHITLIIGIKH